MRRLVAVFLSSCLLAAGAFSLPGTQNPGRKKEVLTNDSVIEMVKLGLGDAIILEKIRHSECNFETSLEGLKQLKGAKVSEAVIREMVVSSNGAQAVPGRASAPVSQADPLDAQEAGIYVQRPNGVVQINPTTFSSTKSNFLGTALTYGIKKTKVRAAIRGASANTEISNPRPVFYFKFGDTSGAANTSMSGFLAFGATSPAEFVLVKMERKSNSREAVLMEVSAFGATTGTREKDIIEYSFEKVRPGLFKVVPKNSLDVGEYCFYYASSYGAVGLAGGKLFDFSVTLSAM